MSTTGTEAAILIARRLWRPIAAALLVQAVLVPASALLPSADGSFGAPFAFVEPGYYWTGIPADHVSFALLALNVLVTAGLFALISFATEAEVSCLSSSPSRRCRLRWSSQSRAKGSQYSFGSRP